MTNHDVLDVNAGETYTIGSGETEEWFRAEVDGTLDVDGSLLLIDDPDLPTEPSPGTTAFDPIDVGIAPLDLDLDIDLQTVPLNVRSMETGLSTFLVGSMGLLLAGSWLSRNYLALTMWAMAFILLIMSGLFGIGLEFFWMGMVLTIILLVAGLIVRWGDM